MPSEEPSEYIKSGYSRMEGVAAGGDPTEARDGKIVSQRHFEGVRFPWSDRTDQLERDRMSALAVDPPDPDIGT